MRSRRWRYVNKRGAHRAGGGCAREPRPTVPASLAGGPEPLETTEFLINERDVAGGSGANFIVRWRSVEPVNPPYVEAVMIGTDAGQGISFVSQAREIVE